MATVIEAPKPPVAPNKTTARVPPVHSLETLASLDEESAFASVQRGLPAKLVHLLSQRLGVLAMDLAALLQLTPRSLHRRLEDGRLAAAESERLYAVNRLFFQATEVLGDEEKAVRWFKSPLRVLGGRTPLACAETLLGLRRVENVLLRIDDVVYS